jgi:hypothetical protein
MSQTDSVSRKTPVWGILSIVMTPAGVIFAAAVMILVELTVSPPEGVSMHQYVPVTTRVVMLGTLAFVASSIISAFVAWFRRERPQWLPAVGLATTILIITVFHFLSQPG